MSLAAARNENRNLSYGVSASVVINGDASVDQTSQGVRFTGDFSTNVAVVAAASVQWRF